MTIRLPGPRLTRHPPLPAVLWSLLTWIATTAAAAADSRPAADAAQLATQLARGAYLVHGMGCADCHTPLKPGNNGPVPDLARGLSGHPQHLRLAPPPRAAGGWLWGGAATNTAFYGPWGVSYAANLTPDRETGIGNWTAEQFVAALRTGRHAGSGRPIAPPMPWQAFAKLDDADLRAMYAYLMAQPPVRNAVPVNRPPDVPARSPAAHHSARRSGAL